MNFVHTCYYRKKAKHLLSPHAPSLKDNTKRVMLFLQKKKRQGHDKSKMRDKFSLIFHTHVQ